MTDNPQLSKYISLHRVSEILLSLMSSQIISSKKIFDKYPNEAKVVEQLLKEFIERKIEEIYGIGQIVSALNEELLSKEEAQALIMDMLNEKTKTISEPEQEFIEPTTEVGQSTNEVGNEALEVVEVKDKTLDEVQAIRKDILAKGGDPRKLKHRLKQAARPTNPEMRGTNSASIPGMSFFNKGSDPLNVNSIINSLTRK